MQVKDAIGTEQNVALQANWRYRRSRYKQIQLYRTDLQEVSGPIRIKLKSYFMGKLLLSVQMFSAPAVKCLPVRPWWW